MALGKSKNRATGTASRNVQLARSPVEAIRNENELAEALELLRQTDPDCIGHMLETAGPPPLRARTPSLSGLAWIIVSQQVSTASARAIYARVEQKFGDLEHRHLLAASDEDLRACGLSSPKMRTLRNIASAIDEGSLDLAALHRLDAEAAREHMTAVKGIGPWTADIYLLFCLGHPDVWPAGDLALQEGVRIALRMRARPDAAKLEKVSKRWRPYRAAAARLIWAYYGKVLEQRREAAKG